jgi:predicted membrane protein
MMNQSFSYGRALIGLVVVLVGLFFLLENMGVRTMALWRLGALVLIVLGLVKFFGTRTRSARMFGSILIAVGFLLLFDLWNFWPLLIIVLGLHILWRGVGPRGVPQSGSSSTTTNQFSEFAIFGGSQRVVNSTAFEGGEITSVFGGIELDLRNAKIAADTVPVIDMFVLFGGVEIRVPESWEVDVELVAIFGGVEDGTGDPRAAFGTPESPPRLVLKGYALFGGLEIKN